jgi:Ni,Fe-hydrogenase III small subunit/formate hydrogenlyase subunit 6/NADH:ubiquinone oxidoreductase subunit I
MIGKLRKIDSLLGGISDPNGIKNPFAGILSNNVETIKDPLNKVCAAENYRGRISLVAKIKQGAKEFDLEQYKTAEEICASRAIRIRSNDNENNSWINLDKGKCILCGRCEEAYPDLFKLENKFAPSTKNRQDLIESPEPTATSSMCRDDAKSFETIGSELKSKISKIFGRSLAIREVDAGSCNGCEVEITALNNPIYDIERFGIHFVASPRHADLLLVTGPASKNMELALRRTYDATPDPKIVVAVGACACGGGIFGETYATTGGIDKVVPVDVYIPGCPPRPEALLYGLLLAVNRLQA